MLMRKQMAFPKMLNKMIGLLLSLAILMVCVPAFAESATSSLQEMYAEAELMMVQGDYTGAATKFEAMGGYSDASKMAMYCKAISCAELGMWEMAISALNELGDFKDSKQLATYYTGRMLLDYATLTNKETATEQELNECLLLAQEASSVFSELALYKDSLTRYAESETLLKAFRTEQEAREVASLEKIYQDALVMINEGKYDEAYLLFESLRGYKDVDTLLSTNQNLMAVKKALFKQVGKYVTYGAYEQDNNQQNGKEPIEWLVLDYDEATQEVLLISRNGLDARQYHHTSPYPTWENSDIRAWLNNEFLNTAFTEEERSAIAETKLSTPNYAGNNGGADTVDKVFLLSREEAEKYFANDTARKATPTKYAVEQGGSQNRDSSDKRYTLDGVGCCWWWLRSPGSGGYEASCVIFAGRLSYFSVNLDEGVVRPAIKLNLNAL